ncbi:MAG TPA: hypothetical protein VG323_17685 [Thermoanaerobaculia bacterium]|nr:hypothetical protein [Thermoanaerobaculia bacterium]
MTILSRARARARISRLPALARLILPRNVVAITLGRRIWITRELPPAEMEILLRHEMVHVRQMEQLGVIVFLARYLGEYVRNRFRGMSHDAAYRAISFEAEAFEAEKPGAGAGSGAGAGVGR